MLCQCEYTSPDNAWQLGTAYVCMTAETDNTMVLSVSDDSIHILYWNTLSEGILSQIWSELAPIFAILS